MGKYDYTTAVLLVMCQHGYATPSTMTVWAYLQLLEGSHIKIEDFKLHTGLSKKAVNAALKVLIGISVVSRERESVTTPYAYRLHPLKAPKTLKVPQESAPFYYYTNILEFNDINILIPCNVININNLHSIGSKGVPQESTGKPRRVTVKSILADSDWKTITDLLSEYFPKHSIRPTDLVYRNRWNRLCILLYDDSFNLHTYAEWYRQEKFDRLGLQWGLFVSKSMCEEFIDAEDRFISKKKRISSKMHTTKKWEGKEADISWLEKLEDVDD